MYIQQLYTNCLAHAAYYIEDNGEAAVVDPLRDPEPYINLAKERGATIKYVLETHFHADFVSGHIDLAKKTGAAIIYGPGAKPDYEVTTAKDGDLLPLGNIIVRVVHTPGHTLESACYVVADETGKDIAVCTGDTLFVGEVGRPDLLSGNLSKEELAAMLFDSLAKLKALADDVVVYPGHGAGSACGKNIGKETQTTIGEQRVNNYAMLEQDKDNFIRVVTSDLPVPPAYFFKDAAMNKKGYKHFDEVQAAGLKPLTVAEFAAAAEGGAMILDTRSALAFGDGYIPGSINIGLGGDFAVWVGTVIPFGSRLLLVCEAGSEREAVTRLARVGYDDIGGCLAGGIPAWKAEGAQLDTVDTYDAEACKELIDDTGCRLLDVRRPAEVAGGKIRGAMHIPLSELPQRLGELSKDELYLVYCAGGYRSMIAVSLLKRAGFSNVANVAGGIAQLKKLAPDLMAALL